MADALTPPNKSYGEQLREIGDSIIDDISTVIEIADEIPEQMPTVLREIREAAHAIWETCAEVDY